ncbi:tetraacyldisaccharide 4'-kinase [Ichthyenterobacterium sp. W332]|uniref:Tetraacyldisaccharide 4'-kinase n=1 Tax=Microcosmobacter mediterraneus TaxID=3075607 RepID=A0ABU2YJI1_9FLAO|nr:tetraacyldisaccharide 4'-kinase [Ichthyenterobacterium sp. W332]MDT0558318.1 tetraacyldisaccharide 4'-kinase [Ichthyenterobacterium sp. W332]
MKIIRLLLLPIVPLYWLVTGIRNMLYDFGVFDARTYNFPVICVGNLSTGGTGKTPTTEYLIRLLKDNYSLATLSRGYGRNTNGYLLADENSSADTIGDEPFQLYSKFKNDILVAVDEQRQEGIKKLKSQLEDLQIVLLDDAFQHRAVKAGFNILLTAYDNLYVNDMCLPTGNLREPVSGADRAQVIIVTKCPKDISKAEQSKIRSLLKSKTNQSVYFSYIKYSETIISNNSTKYLEDLKSNNFTLVTGIADANPLVTFLEEKQFNFEHLNFKDHHNFTSKDISELETKSLILTTEKDYMRLKDKLNDLTKLYYTPIEMVFVDEGSFFENDVYNFVTKFY